MVVIYMEGTAFGTELANPTSLLPVTGDRSVYRQVGYTELDRNGHMNNTRYMNWVDDLLPAAFHREHPVRQFSICYMSEVREGEELLLDWRLSDGPELLVDAYREMTEDGKKNARVFSAKVIF